VRRFRCSLLTGRDTGSGMRAIACATHGKRRSGSKRRRPFTGTMHLRFWFWGLLPNSMELCGGGFGATVGVRGRNVLSVKALPGVTSRGGSARGASKDAAQLGKPKRATARAPRRVDQSWHERIAPPIVGGPGSANCAGPMESPRGLTASCTRNDDIATKR